METLDFNSLVLNQNQKTHMDSLVICLGNSCDQYIELTSNRLLNPGDDIIFYYRKIVFAAEELHEFAKNYGTMPEDSGDTIHDNPETLKR